MSSKKALFLDRDGIVNVDHGYVSSPQDVEFVDGIFELIHQYCQQGYLPVIVTNQSGIARGMFSEAEFHELMAWMQNRFSQHQLPQIAVYYCPHHPDVGESPYRQVCDCRKPAPGMFYRAARELNIDLASSTMIGDSWRDIQAAHAAGVLDLIYVNEKPAPDSLMRVNQVNRVRDLVGL